MIIFKIVIIRLILEIGSAHYNKFLSALGDKTELQGYPGFNGGLDVQFGKTGTYMISAKWKGFDIVYHVSTYLPFVEIDPQQIERKRHIGNGILSLTH
jgi:RAP1 GTPase activating protein 1